MSLTRESIQKGSGDKRYGHGNHGDDTPTFILHQGPNEKQHAPARQEEAALCFFIFYWGFAIFSITVSY